MPHEFKANPWLSIWTKPRETIRSITAYNPRYGFIVLCIIYGLTMMLHLSQSLSLGKTMSVGAIMVVVVLFSLLAGFIGITISSALFYWVGKWFGGQSNYANVRAAVAWSNVPGVVSLVLWAVLLITFERSVFDAQFSQTQFVGKELGVTAFVFLSETVLSIWSLVILLKGLSEVQKFSIWKAIFSVLIPFAMVALLSYGLSLITQAPKA